MKVLVTGVAGFIGHQVVARLLASGIAVAGLDNMSPYYDVRLKEARLADLKGRFGFEAWTCDIADAERLDRCFADAGADIVIHLAAQAGVRYSLTHPQSYVASNLAGFVNVIEACRRYPPRHFLYASSSSVYGGNSKLPFSETDPTDRPLSLYAATKRANESMAYSYSHLFGLAATGLRFFTVYGDWGRPDMAFFSFAEAILAGRPIEVFNNGQMRRDFTYGGDAAEAVVRLCEKAPDRDSGPPHRVVNIASGRRVALLEFIAALEAALGRKAEMIFKPHQPGDMIETWADTQLLSSLTGYTPETTVVEGIARFARWFERYRNSR